MSAHGIGMAPNLAAMIIPLHLLISDTSLCRSENRHVRTQIMEQVNPQNVMGDSPVASKYLHTALAMHTPVNVSGPVRAESRISNS